METESDSDWEVESWSKALAKDRQIKERDIKGRGNKINPNHEKTDPWLSIPLFPILNWKEGKCTDI